MRCFDIGRAAHASTKLLCREAKVWLGGAVRSHHSEGRWALWAAQGLVCTIHEARPSDYCDFCCHGAAQTAFRPGCFVTAGAANTPELESLHLPIQVQSRQSAILAVSVLAAELAMCWQKALPDCVSLQA